MPKNDENKFIKVDAKVKKAVSLSKTDSKSLNKKSAEAGSRKSKTSYKFQKITGKLKNKSLTLKNMSSKNTAKSVKPPKIEEKPKETQKTKKEINSEKFFIIKDKSFDNQIRSLYKVKTVDRKNAFRVFFEYVSCYDILPTSSKMLVLEKTLSLRSSFNLMLRNEVKVAMVWNETDFKFIGVLSLSDFMSIIQYFYQYGSSDKNISKLDTWTIQMWRDTKKESHPLISVMCQEKVQTAVKLILKQEIRQLPVLDPINGNIINMISNKRVLNYLYRNLSQLPLPHYMNKTMEELCIGTRWDVISVFSDQKLLEVWNVLLAKKKSSVPVLDRKQNLIGLYSKSDAIKILENENFSVLDQPISEVLKLISKPFSGVITCRVNEPLSSVVYKLVSRQIYSMVIVDQENHLIGIVTLSDIMEYITREYV